MMAPKYIGAGIPALEDKKQHSFYNGFKTNHHYHRDWKQIQQHQTPERLSPRVRVVSVWKPKAKDFSWGLMHLSMKPEKEQLD